MKYDYEIDKYLRKIPATESGNCLVCDKVIGWSRGKLSSHKRSGNCHGQEIAERQMFKETAGKSSAVKSNSSSRTSFTPEFQADLFPVPQNSLHDELNEVKQRLFAIETPNKDQFNEIKQRLNVIENRMVGMEVTLQQILEHLQT